jgi:hypothetical protein
MKLMHGDEETVARPFTYLRANKLCLELDCNAVWTDDVLVCPACGGREVSLLETFVNRVEKKASLALVLPIRRMA